MLRVKKRCAGDCFGHFGCIPDEKTRAPVFDDVDQRALRKGDDGRAASQCFHSDKRCCFWHEARHQKAARGREQPPLAFKFDRAEVATVTVEPRHDKLAKVLSMRLIAKELTADQQWDACEMRCLEGEMRRLFGADAGKHQREPAAGMTGASEETWRHTVRDGWQQLHATRAGLLLRR